VNVPYSSGVHGGGASPAVAANSALVVTWETGARGRSNRGRSFLAGMPGASLETGGARWGTAILTDAADAIDGFLTALAGTDPGMNLQVVSQHSELGPHHRPVNEGLARQKVGSQRRRTER
jgi:hypothetical protein